MYACHVYLQMQVLVTNTKQMNHRLMYHVGCRATARQQQLHVMHMQADLECQKSQAETQGKLTSSIAGGWS
jgi:hypothetical protein